MFRFENRDLMLIEELHDLLSNIISSLESLNAFDGLDDGAEEGGEENPVLCLFTAQAILEEKDPKQMKDIKELLYNGFRAVEDYTMSEPALDDLVHKAYFTSVNNEVFYKDLGLQKRVSNLSPYTKPLLSLWDAEMSGWRLADNQDEFLKFISPLGEVNLTSQNGAVYSKTLPFYKEGVELLRVVSDDFEGEGCGFYFLSYKGDYVLIGENNQLIHEFNDNGVLNLNKDTVFDYLKFLCAFSEDEDGDMIVIIENEKSEYLENTSGYQKSRHLRKYDGAKISDANALGMYTIYTRYMYAGYLYNGFFEVNIRGEFEIKDQEVVGLP